MIGFERFPVVRKNLGRTSVLSYGSISNMANQKWFCLRTFGGHLQQGTEQAHDEKELPGAGPCNGETTAGLWLRSISRSDRHSPALPLSCFPVLVLPSHPLQLSPLCSQWPSGVTSSLWWCCTGRCPGGTAAHPALEDGGNTVGNRTEGILSRGPAKPSVKPTVLSGNSFPMCLCNS